MFKKRKVYMFVFSCLFFMFSGLVIYNNFPAIASKVLAARTFAKLKLRVRKIKVNGEVCSYAEGGTGPTLVFVHGFQGDKKYWVNYIKPIASSYHIVMPDLPAHGDSSFGSDQSFDLTSLANFLDAFLKEKNINDFQLIGTSLGGGVSLKYSALFPEKVSKLTLLNPIGIRPESKKEFLRIVNANKRLFFPSNIPELDELYVYLLGHPLPYNEKIKKYVLSYLIQKKNIYQKVYTDLISGDDITEDLPNINVPTLLLVGEHDNVSRPIDFEIYSAKMPKCQAILVKDGYHVFKKDAFDVAMKKMHEFIDSDL